MTDSIRGTFKFRDWVVYASYRASGNNRGGFNKCLKITSVKDVNGKEIDYYDFFGDDKFEVTHATLDPHQKTITLEMKSALRGKYERVHPEVPKSISFSMS